MKGLSSTLIVASLLVALRTDAAIEVELAASCGSPDHFEAELEELLGVEGAQTLQLRVRIAQASDATYRLEIETTDWSRKLEDADCDALYRAALVIAAAAAEGRVPPELGGSETQEQAGPAATPRPSGASSADEPSGASSADEPSGASSADEPSGASSADEPAPATPALVPEVQRTEAPRALGEPATQPEGRSSPPKSKKTKPPRPNQELFGFLGGGIEWGSAPEVRGLLSLGAGFRRASFGVAMDLRFLPPVSTLTLEDKGLRLLATGLRLCGSWDPVEIFHVLFGVSVTRFDARGVGIEEYEWDQTYMPSLELEAQIRPLRWQHFALDLAVHGRLGLTRPVFVIDPNTTAYEIPRWGGGALFRALAFF